MFTYKVIFARNCVISCSLLPNHTKLNGGYYYHQDRGHLIYAIIEAPSAEKAVEVAEHIVQRVVEETFGKDFVA